MQDVSEHGKVAGKSVGNWSDVVGPLDAGAQQCSSSSSFTRLPAAKAEEGKGERENPMASKLRLLRRVVAESRMPPPNSGSLSRCLVSVSSHPPEKFSDFSPHTAKWMQDSSKKSPMELINEIPPIKVDGRIVACEGDNNPALGHPIEFICLDRAEPSFCKYCGLRYIQEHHH